MTDDLGNMDKTGSLLSVMQCSTPPIFIDREEDENSPENSLTMITTHPNHAVGSNHSATRRSNDTDLAGLPCSDSVMFHSLLRPPKTAPPVTVPSRPKVISALQRSFEVRHPIGVPHWHNDGLLRASSSISIRVHFHDSLEEFPLTQQVTCQSSPRISRAPPRFQILSKNDQNDNDSENEGTCRKIVTKLDIAVNGGGPKSVFVPACESSN
ncbi:unnamed protein product [Calicophoron daubneyi]|uniref:Uncharacterized protein n=1 Tax=Calicophoron daubneyi TaxID=300641 RepID=A0AAV2SZ41_CALDB